MTRRSAPGFSRPPHGAGVPSARGPPIFRRRELAPGLRSHLAGAGVRRLRAARADLRRGDHRHRPTGRVDPARDRAARGVRRLGDWRLAQRYVRQRGGIDHRALRAARGAGRSGEGADHRCHHREQPAGTRAGHRGRQHRPRAAELLARARRTARQHADDDDDRPAHPGAVRLHGARPHRSGPGRGSGRAHEPWRVDRAHRGVPGEPRLHAGHASRRLRRCRRGRRSHRLQT